MQYSIPKGVFDILPDEPLEEDFWRQSDHWQYIEEVMRQTAGDYGFKEIRTPIFERTELFVRGVGETSDIVSKEMYTFEDKAGRSMTLRPEGTASVIRAFVENHLHQKGSLHKFFYIGPMFRYERPQSGRYRQHHQFGAEALGVCSPEQDVELIDMVCEIYHRLGIQELTVHLNSVGDEASRTRYKEALQAYLKPHFEKLSDDSKERFSKNVLRILDSKSPQDQALLTSVPSILDHLSPEAKDHFKKVCSLLEKAKIPYLINPKLVRGLDYYNGTVFEITSGQLGAQNSVGGGGRYDGLVEAVGGPSIPGIGFATGMERILQTMTKQGVAFPPAPHPLIFFIPLGEAASAFCFELLCSLRHKKIAADMDLSGKKVQHGLQLANQYKADYCAIIGDQELATGHVQLKHMASREVETIALSEITTILRSKRHA